MDLGLKTHKIQHFSETPCVCNTFQSHYWESRDRDFLGGGGLKSRFPKVFGVKNSQKFPPAATYKGVYTPDIVGILSGYNENRGFSCLKETHC